MNPTRWLMGMVCALVFGSLQASEMLECGRVVYINPDHGTEPVAFAVPESFVANDVVQATYQGGWDSEPAEGQARRFRQRITAGYSDDARKGIRIEKAGFSGKRLVRFEIDGQRVENARLADGIFSCPPPPLGGRD